MLQHCINNDLKNKDNNSSSSWACPQQQAMSKHPCACTARCVCNDSLRCRHLPENTYRSNRAVARKPRRVRGNLLAQDNDKAKRGIACFLFTRHAAYKQQLAAQQVRKKGRATAHCSSTWRVHLRRLNRRGCLRCRLQNRRLSCWPHLIPKTALLLSSQ